MSKYTVELREIMNDPGTNEKLYTALSTYPLYKQKNTSIPAVIPNREELNKRLLNAYKYREIGFETVGRFLDELEIAMCEIMPYYNDLYKTVEIMAGIEDPFGNVDFTENYIETRTSTAQNDVKTTSNDEGSTSSNNEGSSTTNTETSGKANATDNTSSSTSTENASKNVHSETPQGDIISTAASNIDSVSYADDVTWNKANNTESTTASSEHSESNESDTKQTATSTNSTTATSTNTTTSDTTGTQTANDTIEHTFTKKGNQGVNTYAHDMIEFRESIIDVTNRLINDNRISELFMRVF